MLRSPDMAVERAYPREVRITRAVRVPWPLLAVLAVQAALSVSMVRAWTAFGDEALYLSAGRIRRVRLPDRDPLDHDWARARNRYRLTGLCGCLVVDRGRGGPGRHRGRRLRGTPAVAADTAAGRACAVGAA